LVFDISHDDSLRKEMNYEQELEKALGIIRRAGDLALQFFDKAPPAEEKADTSPVTIADRECERFITRQLQDHFAKDGILGEEGIHIPSQSGRRWIIDPIDGTRDFVRHNPFWSIQLALQEGKQVVLGIIYSPCMDQMLFAASESGCFFNGMRASASNIARLDKSILMVSGFKSTWNSWSADAVRFLTENCWTVRCYGGSYDVIIFAQAKAEIWLSGSGMEWDYAPVQVIARECGARFLTKDGTDRIDARHCVLCSPGIESEIRRILRIHHP
jgi:histidinol-phosphatase